LDPDSTKVCSAEAVLAMALNAISEPEMAIRGDAVTVAVADNVLEAAPELETETFPDKEPEGAEAATRTDIVAETVPPDGAKAKLALKFVPLLETSKPFGAATVTLPVKLDPLTVKVWGADADPSIALKALNDPDVESEGGATTVPLTANVLLVAPPLDTVMLPLSAPMLAAAEIRTEIVVLANVPPLWFSVRLPA
jgi:hypothetical protein